MKQNPRTRLLFSKTSTFGKRGMGKDNLVKNTSNFQECKWISCFFDFFLLLFKMPQSRRKAKVRCGESTEFERGNPRRVVMSVEMRVLQFPLDSARWMGGRSGRLIQCRTGWDREDAKPLCIAICLVLAGLRTSFAFPTFRVRLYIKT